MGYCGEGANEAAADLISGRVSPCGKLAETFPKSLEDTATTDRRGNGYFERYPEGGLVGYKYYEYSGIAPAYPFGYGLSYTTFEYSDVKLLPGNGNATYARVAVTVKNTGKYEGEEVVQLYVRDEAASITRPVKELKGFDKIKLKVGESKTVTFDVKREQLGFYNNQMKFVVEKGDFTFMVGGNSRDLQEIKYTLN